MNKSKKFPAEEISIKFEQFSKSSEWSSWFIYLNSSLTNAGVGVALQGEVNREALVKAVTEYLNELPIGGVEQNAE